MGTTGAVVGGRFTRLVRRCTASLYSVALTSFLYAGSSKCVAMYPPAWHLSAVKVCGRCGRPPPWRAATRTVPREAAERLGAAPRSPRRPHRLAAAAAARGCDAAWRSAGGARRGSPQSCSGESRRGRAGVRGSGSSDAAASEAPQQRRSTRRQPLRSARASVGDAFWINLYNAMVLHGRSMRGYNGGQRLVLLQAMTRRRGV